MLLEMFIAMYNVSTCVRLLSGNQINSECFHLVYHYLVNLHILQGIPEMGCNVLLTIPCERCI